MSLIRKIIKKNFLSIFKLKKDKYNLNLSKKNTDEWDSINHLNLMLSLEKVFDINFSHKEFINLTSIEKIEKAIKNKKK
tara:strand:- start:961 stop:1197 length:237 start_codon:yes stop_codon:yes gene_type:complete